MRSNLVGWPCPRFIKKSRMEEKGLPREGLLGRGNQRHPPMVQKRFKIETRAGITRIGVEWHGQKW